MSITTTFTSLADTTSFDCRNSNSDYATARNAATGNALGGNDVGIGHTSTPAFFIHRLFLPFDTSALPDNAFILSATLRIYASNKSDSDNNGRDYLVTVLSSAADPSLPTLADFDAFTVNSPVEGSNHVDITDITTGAYNTLTLNASGLAWISKTGISQLALRSGDDIEAVAPNLTGNSGNDVNIDLTTNKPQLDITYTIPGGFFDFM